MHRSGSTNEKTPVTRGKKNRWHLIGVSVFCFLLVGFILGHAAGIGLTAPPGSEDDPLVTVSWVRDSISQALQGEQKQRQVLEERLQKLEGGVVDQPPGAGSAYPAPVFTVIEAAPGEKLLAGAGTEIILRSGQAKVLAGPYGGLSDLTAGCNLSTGQPVKRDHLLLAARDDGRGIVLETQAFLLVRGGYAME